MDHIGILVAALASPILLLLYGVRKARRDWNDPAMLEAFFMGGVSVAFVLLPALIIGRALDLKGMTPPHAAFSQAFFVAAIPEECAKFLTVFYVARRYRDDLAPADMVFLSLAVALGFAAIENIAYLVRDGNWATLALIRGLTAVPGHATDGIAMGALMTVARYRQSNRSIWWLCSLAVPILLHGSYDFPPLLVGENHSMLGVLPAWALMSALVGVAVVYGSNKIRAFAALAHDCA
jgi:RsiW-degrading membrane proteinase PrsW (M82 family)